MTGNDSDAQDSGSDENDDEMDGGSDHDDVDDQDRTWYTSGGTYPVEWIDPGMEYDGGYGCIDWGPSYDQDTGEYLGEICRENGYRNSAFQWNLSACIDAGGIVSWANVPVDEMGNNSTTHSAFRFAPDCKIQFATINTSSGEVLLIYQWDAFSLETTCGGVTDYPANWGALSGKEYYVATGGAMDCQHSLYYTINYGDNYEGFEEMTIWSVVYAIQDATVV
jgi:hypothetical protein